MNPLSTAVKKFLAIKFPVIIFFLIGTTPSGAQTFSVSSNYLEIDGDSGTGIFGLGTSSAYSLPSASLMYCFPGPGCTSTIVPMVNGNPYDFGTATTTSSMVASGSGLGAYLQITKSIAAGVLLTAHYEIVTNPVTGSQPDTAMFKFTFTNTGSAPATLGLRVEIDTMVNGNDGANISINNGASTVPVDSLYTQKAGTLPMEWWDYDIPPPGTPNLTGHGVVFNNPYDAAATKPDALEIAYWPNVSNPGQWTTGILGTAINDSAVVYWWTGAGDNSNGQIILNPGQSVTFLTYYGLSEIALLTTPTPSCSSSCVLTSATLSFASDDAGEIFINGNLAHLCGNGCWSATGMGTGQNNIPIPISWINTSGDNVIAAYGYAVDNVFSASTWQLILTYSNCSTTYYQTGDPCVIAQYLFDPNAASSGLPNNFPSGWNNTGFNDSAWAAPATTGPPNSLCICDTIPSPGGGNVPWTWGNANWFNVNVGDGYMYREHFQMGVSACSTSCLTPIPTFTPTNSPTSTPSPTPTNSPTLTSSFTPTLTATVTPTFTPTATATNTPTATPTCVPQVWPDPFNPQWAVGQVLKIGCVTPGSEATIYTISGEKVWETSQSSYQYGSSFTAVWDGKNTQGAYASPGIYYYVIHDGDKTLARGKFLLMKGP